MLISGLCGAILLFQQQTCLLCPVRIAHSTMIPNTGWRLNVNASFVHTFLIFLCFIHVSWILLSYVPICLKVECGSVWRDSCDVSAAVGPDGFIPVSWWERMSQLKGSVTEVGGVTLMSTAVKKKTYAEQTRRALFFLTMKGYSCSSYCNYFKINVFANITAFCR